MDTTQDQSPIGVARQHMDLVLQTVRKMRDEIKPHYPGARELSEALTCFETGCMWMNRAGFADKPYSPLTLFARLTPVSKPAENTDVPKEVN